MLRDHPTVEELKGFIRDASRPGNAVRNARILRHLLAGCPVCRDQLQVMGWSPERLDRLVFLPGAFSGLRDDSKVAQNGYNYDSAFERAETAVTRFLASEPVPVEPPEQLLAALDRISFPEQDKAVQEQDRFASPQLVQLVIDRGHAARYADPEEMIHWARLAQSIADRCPPESLGDPAKLSDLRARAWGHFGNALRVAGQLREAEEAMTTALQHLEAGTGDPVVRARLYEQVASLHTFQRRFDTTIELLEKAAEIHRQLGETHALARTMVKEAIAFLYSGEAESAVRILNQAIPLIDHEVDPHLLLAACHNLIRCYIDLDRPDQALSLYSETQELYREFSDDLILLRASWQEGQLLRDLGHLRAAESALLRARMGFTERGLMYEVAVVSLDLAAVYAKLRDTENLRQTAAETVPIFQALRVRRETLGALLQLQQVADQEQQALELIRTLNAQLEPLARRPRMK
ncbi:MAG TPA: tetratricopeptide repeat protein [Thermoanaerobaculia bacterium]|nr:tetratricopeptide repeat protein [Thermoanaerobaculia bacterium]